MSNIRDINCYCAESESKNFNVICKCVLEKTGGFKYLYLQIYVFNFKNTMYNKRKYWY